MEGSRPLTQDDLKIIKEALVRPANVSEPIFEDFVDILIRNNEEKIIGVETDDRIKGILAERERMERKRLARVNVRMTENMEENGNFPSERDKPLPKYFTQEEVQPYLKEWIQKLQEEIYDYFKFREDRESLEAVKKDFRQLIEELKAPKFKKRITQKDFDLIAGTIISSEIHGGTEINTLFDFLKTIINDDTKISDILYKINNFKTELRPLTEEELQRILSIIRFSDYYKGGSLRKDSNITSRMLPKVDEVNQRHIKRDIKNQLMVMKFHPYLIEDFINSFKLRFEQSLTLEGKYVGNVMAAAMGESSTQQTLNTFHSSGDRKGRSQITGFQRLKAHLEASDNPPRVTNVIFTKTPMSEEEMFLRANKFEYCVLANLIESYSLIKVGPENPKPRWEIIHDTVFGQGVGIHYRGDQERFKLHRDNPIFTGNNPNNKPGYILEIKLSVQELYFRRLTVGMVAHALEENSSRLIRVTSSSAELGIINVYFNFSGIPDLKVFPEDSIPEYINDDPFRYALENVVFRELKGVHISGIPNLIYVTVKNNRNGLTINFPDSYLEISTPRKRATFSFKDIQVISWGLSSYAIKEFILVTLAPYAIKDHNFNFSYSNEFEPFQEEDNYDYQASVDTEGLQIYDSETSSYRSMNMNDLQTALLQERGEIPIGYLISRDQNGKIKVEFQEAEGITNLIVEINPKFLDTFQDQDNFFGLRISLDEIGNIFGNAYSNFANDENSTESTYLLSPATNQILIRNFNRVEASSEYEDFSDFFLKDCATLLVNSSRMEHCAKKFYYLCEGRNFQRILSHPMVDSQYSRTDSSVDIYNILGVESARTILVKEIRECVSDKLNPIHIDLMADSLTARTPKNKPLAQHFYGNSAKNTEFFSKSFEKATEVFMKSFGSSDRLRSFAGQVIGSRLTGRSLMNKAEREYIESDPGVFGVDFPNNRARFNKITGLVENVFDDKGKEEDNDSRLKVIEVKKILGDQGVGKPVKPRRRGGIKGLTSKSSSSSLDSSNLERSNQPLEIEKYSSNINGELFNNLLELEYKEGKIRKDRIHYGQRKLLITEISFLTHTNSPYCVYAGAAPSNKGAFLASLFPKIKFILIDPNPFNIIPRANVSVLFIKNLNEIKSREANIYVYNKHMTIEVAKKLSELDCTFISDVRTAMENGKYPTDTDILFNLAQQFNWILALKPKLSMLKFRHPFHNPGQTFDPEKLNAKTRKIVMDEISRAKENGLDLFEDYRKGELKYFNGNIMIQAWSKASSAETRLITNAGGIVSYGNHETYDNKMFYYNKVERQRKIKMDLEGLDGCGDCRIEYQTWLDYAKKNNAPIDKLVKLVNDLLPRQHPHSQYEDQSFQKYNSYDFDPENVSSFEVYNFSVTVPSLQSVYFQDLSLLGDLTSQNLLVSNPFLNVNAINNLLASRKELSLYASQEKLTKKFGEALEMVNDRKFSNPELEKLKQIMEQLNLGDNEGKFLSLFDSSNQWVNYLLGKNMSGIMITNNETNIKSKEEVLEVFRDDKPFSEMIKTGEELMNFATQQRGKIDLILGAAYLNKKKKGLVDSYQELLQAQLIMREIIMSIFILKDKGTMIIRIFDTFTLYSADLLYLCSSLFEEVQIIKPPASKSHNSEKFLVGLRFKQPDAKNEEENFIYPLLGNFYQNSADPKNSPMRLFKEELLEQDELFKSFYVAQNEDMLKKEHNNLKTISSFLQQSSK